MSSGTPKFIDSGLMNCALRMVIPMRREFGRALDVQSFLHDLPYAKEVLDEARTSQNPKLREYAEYLTGKMLGPRDTAAPSAAVARQIDEASSKADSAVPVPGAAAAAGGLTPEAQAKAIMLAKYRAGLR
jgi:hypothetical protein